MKAAIYCRVSTDDQEKEGTSLQSQLEACLKHCESKGYQVARRFSETYSGLTLDRPELVSLRGLVRACDVDVVVIYCLDRLSRNATHGVIIRDELDKHHVSLESVTEDIDKSPLGEAITYLRGTFAQVEAEKIRERTMRGKLAHVKEGKFPQGTGIGIYGYDWNKTTGKRTVNEYETKIVQKIFAMVLEGVSFNKIAIELNRQGIKSKSGALWYPLTVRRIANNPTYTGKTYYGMSKRISKTRVTTQPKEAWTLLPDITPAIVTEEMFKRCQDRIKQAKQARPIKPNAAYLLTGFVRCPKCGSPIGGTTMSGKYRYYKCRGSTPTATRGKICDAGYIKADELETAVCNKVLNMMANPKALLESLTDKKTQEPDEVFLSLTKQVDQVRKKLKAYPAKEKNLYDLMNNDAVTKEYVLESIAKLKQQRLNDEQQLKSLLDYRNQLNRKPNLSVSLSEMAGTQYSDLFYHFLDYETVHPKDEDPYAEPYNVAKPPAELLVEKRALLESIRLKLLADPNTFSFTFELNGKIVSSAEADELTAFFNDLRRQEHQFEDNGGYLSTKELLDPKSQLPEDSPFAKVVNQAKKDLVTTEQTWASLHACSLRRRPGG